MQKGLDFDDVLIKPVPSTVNSRDDVDLSVDLGILKLKIPIIASPMKGIVSPELIIRLSELGGIGILHRFYDDYNEWAHIIVSKLEKEAENFGAAVGLNNKFYPEVLASGAKIICIDIANGYIDSILKYAETIANHITTCNYKCLLMAGNVATSEGASDLFNVGVNLVRVGIGSGQLCTTRNVTGVGIPQITAIQHCYQTLFNYSKAPTFVNEKLEWEFPRHNNRFLVADGGTRNSGDIVKALAAGADVVMLGSLLGKTKESAHNGTIYGMASRRLQEEYFSGVKSVGGIEKEAEKTHTLEELIDEISWGIKSACTYLNARNINELRKNAEFI